MHRAVSSLALRDGRAAERRRTLPDEVAVALSFNGSTQAVMMATPDALEDFATGFALTEGIASGAEILDMAVVATERGIDVQTWLAEPAAARLAARRRTMAGPVGCGLCGIDSIDGALRPLPVLGAGPPVDAAALLAAVAALPGRQPLHDATRAVHAAALMRPDGSLGPVREDVGRHNALDKLAGALARGALPAAGAVILTSRISIDLVQKCALMGVPVLVGVSAPTAQAVAVADAAGLALVGLARDDGCEVFCHVERLSGIGAAAGAA